MNRLFLLKKSELKTIFDKFKRGENARFAKGTGLGLYIVKNVAELHGGEVSAALSRDGKIVFTLELSTNISHIRRA